MTWYDSLFNEIGRAEIISGNEVAIPPRAVRARFAVSQAPPEGGNHVERKQPCDTETVATVQERL